MAGQIRYIDLIVSTDAGNGLSVGSDGGVMVDPADLISADALNELGIGSDGKLYFDETTTIFAYNSGLKALQYTNESGATNYTYVAQFGSQVFDGSAPVAPGVTLEGGSATARARVAGTATLYLLRGGAAPVTAGTYTLDFQINGVSTLATVVDLTAVPTVADTWEAIALTTDTVALGDKLDVIITSDNADLTPAPLGGVPQGYINWSVVVG